MKQLPRTQKGPHRVTPVGEAKPPSIVYAILDLVTLNPHFERDFWSPVCQKELVVNRLFIYPVTEIGYWRNSILRPPRSRSRMLPYIKTQAPSHHTTSNPEPNNPWNKHTAQTAFDHLWLRNTGPNSALSQYNRSNTRFVN